jgi:CIC family chloride channel protein
MTSSRARSFRLPFFPLHRFVHSFESPRYLLKWVLFSALIGVIAGFGAIAFFAAIHFATTLFLGGVVGYLPPNPAGEGKTTVMSFWAAARPWLLPVVTTAGGLVAGIIVFGLAPEAEGHGTDAAIAAFHQGKAVRARIPLVKLVASAITIGSGGSAGREGPVAQISAGFGSILATLLHMDVQDRRIAVAAGIGAGIGSIFRAPLGGAILAAEILYTSDLEVEALIPGLIASIVGYSIFSAWGGWSPIFVVPKDLAFSSPPQLLYYVLIGLLCGGIGWLYAHGFYGITHLFHRLHLPNWIKPAIGGLVVGLIGLVIPQALGMGYGWVQVSMGQGLLSLPLWLILLLPFAKILTTGLSIGSGGSGGIFGPGMVIGGMTGAIVWRLSYHVLPGVPPTPGPFVIVGMMALFGGVAHAPLAVMLMVAEMTGNLSLLAPAMIAVSLSYLIVGQTSIYANQLKTRADSPAHRLQFSFPLLSTLMAQQAMIPVGVQLRETQTIAEAAALLTAQHARGAPVLNDDGMLLGVLTHADIEEVSEAERTERQVGTVMKRDVLVIHASEALNEVLEELTAGRVSWAPVVEAQALTPNRRVIGVISVTDIVRLYREMLSKDTHRMRGLVEGTIMQEVVVSPEMPFAGHPLREAAFPAGCLVVSIRRGSELLFPDGGTTIRAGDTITVLMSPQGEVRWQEYLKARVVQDETALVSPTLSEKS